MLGLADPFEQEASELVADEVGEGPGEVAGVWDVGAGEADFEQSFLLAFGQCLAWAHDP